MDQVALPHQVVFGHQRGRDEDASLACHRQQGVAIEAIALNLSADFVGLGSQENPGFMRLADQ